MVVNDFKLISTLKDSHSTYISGESLANLLGMSRSAVWKRIQNLRAAGYRIDSIPHLGYQYHSSPDLLLAEEIHYHYKPNHLGTTIISFDTVDSTNRIAMEWGAKGVPEGHVAVAEKQTRGKGRLGRTWCSPKHLGIYASVLLRPRLSTQEVAKITLLAAVAVTDTLHQSTNIEGKIRWPNDILVHNNKLCGILTEMHAEADQLQYVVLGIGLNINGSVSDLPKNAVSLRSLTNRRWDRNIFMAQLLKNLETRYQQLLQGHWTGISKDWSKASMMHNRNISINTLDQRIRGKAVGIDSEGALLVRTRDGQKHRFLSGDVTLCR